MLPEIAPLAEQFRVNNGLFLSSFTGVAAGDITTKIHENGNFLLWIAGHMTISRYLLAGLLGVERKHPFGSLFDRGAVVNRTTDYPAIEDIKDAWATISDLLFSRLEELTVEDVIATSPLTLPTRDKSILATMAFLSLHESYHAGQLAYIRRSLGYDSLAG